MIDQSRDHGQWTCDDTFFQKYPRWAEKIVGYFGDFEPDLSRVDKLNLEAARFNFDMTRLRDVVEAAKTDDDFIVQKLRYLTNRFFLV